MPAGAPQRAIDRRFLTAGLPLANSGTDTTVLFTGGAFNRATGIICIGGSDSYVGLLSNGIYGDLIQGAVLPPIGAGPITAISVNKLTGEWLVLGGNRLFRMTADLSASVEITGPNAVTRGSVIEWNGVIFVGKVFNGPVGAGDIEFSTDNGVIWDTVPGIFTGINNTIDGLYTDLNESVLLAINRGGVNAAFTKAPGAASASWTTIPVMNGGTPVNDAAVSDDGRKCVIVDSIGSITTTDDAFSTFVNVAPNDNPFQRNAAAGFPIQNVEYVADLGGFVIFSNSVLGLCAFIDENDMSVIFLSSYLGPANGLGDHCGVTDGFQVLFAGASNAAVCSLRRIGQLAKT